MSVSTLTVLDAMLIVHHTPFPVLLNNLLDETQSTKSDLHNFLLANNYLIEKTSIYRYFNPCPRSNRMPSCRFVELFADFLDLADVEKFALQRLWQMKRKFR